MIYALGFFAAVAISSLLIGLSPSRSQISALSSALFSALCALSAGALSAFLLFGEPSLSGRQMPGVVVFCYAGALAALVFAGSWISVSVCRQAAVHFREGRRLAPVSIAVICFLFQMAVWLLFLYVSLRYAGCYDGRGC